MTRATRCARADFATGDGRACCIFRSQGPVQKGSPRLRAIVVSEFGGPEQLRLEHVADPVPGEGQLRVAVHAAGVNPVDAGNRADGSWAGLRVPCVLGYDIAGVVDRTGPGVTGFRPGDRVMAMTHFRDGAGGYAELAVVDAGLAAPIGEATSMTEAAAVPLAAGTAWTVLARLALPAGSRLLVLGASGGVGLFLLQLAAGMPAARSCSTSRAASRTPPQPASPRLPPDRRRSAGTPFAASVAPGGPPGSGPRTRPIGSGSRPRRAPG